VDTRTVGVEEELLVVDPRTRSVVSRAREVLQAHDAHDDPDRPVGDDVDQELFRHQLETRTAPTTSTGDLVEQIVEARRAAGEAASERGLGVLACATVPTELDEPEVTPDARYRAMLEAYGDVARLGTTCGMHVHVAVTSPEEGVGCLDRIAPWLPVLLAMSTNSPFSGGRDTGYSSWRTQMWSTWPSAGPTERFGSAECYRLAVERLIASGAARDRGMLYWDARLSERQPTLEVRVLDVVTDPEDAGLLAALCRALVETAAEQWAAGEEALPWRSEELRAARWRAARDGLSGTLLHPDTHELRPAREVVTALVRLVENRVDRADDLDRVASGVERVLAGTGAARQRAAHERGGSVEAVVADLLARTTASWRRDATG
jgi:carboxylate-amine ligase